ncbi:glycosyltransferase [uncultured Methylophaga sp.]|uniref:glycosyltransferase n=1 Tax=uncultured Methylophaga sp. TaxID=285271 RepID=UPI0026395E37|nr:glycosyltransferase [uncultured Methylophaga sp.]
MKILFYPEPDGANEYTSNMVEHIETVVGKPLCYAPNIKDIVLRPHKTLCYKKYDIAVINWLENNLRSEGKKLFLFGIVKFLVYILFFKLAARKTVYVRHNICPHDMPRLQARLTRKIVDFGELLFDRKVAHSGHLENQDYFYIPHPLYETGIDAQRVDSAEPQQSYYLMFGRVERYKQIHSIIENWPDREKLLIAGPASDHDYVSELIAEAEGRNIDFDIRFIPDEEIAAIMSAAKATILSHDNEEMIVSGSFFHAISYGVPVIASEQAFLNWLKRDKDFSGLELFSSVGELDAVINKPRVSTKNTILSESAALFGKQQVQTNLRQLFKELQADLP